MFREEQMEFTYDLFNMDDKLVGGYSPRKLPSPRADPGARPQPGNRDHQEEAGDSCAKPAAPGVAGLRGPLRSGSFLDHNPSKAKALLDMIGYVDRDGDGFPRNARWQAIRIVYKYQAFEQAQRQAAELWVKSLLAVGIRAETEAVQFADHLKDRRVGKVPDGEFRLDRQITRMARISCSFSTAPT